MPPAVEGVPTLPRRPAPRGVVHGLVEMRGVGTGPASFRSLYAVRRSVARRST